LAVRPTRHAGFPFEYGAQEPMAFDDFCGPHVLRRRTFERKRCDQDA
jgi:hypothetical protein